MRILTFDIEEWFHILDNAQTKTEAEWGSYESRIHSNMETIFDIVDGANVSATFFVVGWIAEKYPEVVRKISDRGFEVGSHTHMHQLAYEQDRTAFFYDVEKSIKILEDCTGRKVRTFRAPGFSITNSNKWAFEVLAELGIEIDCSVFPAGRSHGGLPQYGHAKPSILSYQGIELKEFPINTIGYLGRQIIFSGGGYFRLFPYSLLRKWMEKSSYVMTYFHPRDFDKDQPLVPGLSASRRFKSYVGLSKTKVKLEKILRDFEFTDLETANKSINWTNQRTIFLQ